MKNKLLILLWAVMIMPALVSAQNQNSVEVIDSHEDDKVALHAMSSSLSGLGWNTSTIESGNWNNLSGVRAENQDGVQRVVEINIGGRGISGEIPPEAMNFRRLRMWISGSNAITGPLPNYGNWVNAEYILFSGTNPPSDHPHPGKWDASHSHTGILHDVFDKLPNLKVFWIQWHRQMDPQPFPSTLYQHPSLTHILLTGAKLTGELEDKFDLPALEVIHLGSNELEGSLPSTLGSSTNLITFDLGHSTQYRNGDSRIDGKATKFFTGNIPESYVNLSNLRRFSISGMQLGGQLPMHVIQGWHPHLGEFRIGGNNFEGELPGEFGDFEHMYYFSVGGNNFSGELPARIVSGMQRVIIFGIGNNNFSGHIPQGEYINGEWKGWRTKERLRTVFLNDNNFTGPLPDMPEYVGDMAMYHAFNNNFEGGIPDTWEELFTLEKVNENTGRTFNNLQLRGNNLQGIIPAWFTRQNMNTDNPGMPDILGGRWSHNDILTNFPNGPDGHFIVGESFPDYSWSSSILPFGSHEEFTIPEGDTFRFDYSDRVHSSDQVQWTKNGSPISGGNDGILVINNVSGFDAGMYRLELTNSNSGLPATIVSEPIELRVGDGSGESENPPSAPSLASPSNGAGNISVTPTLRWNGSGSAGSYRVQVSTSSNFSNPVVNVQEISGTEYTTEPLDHGTTYHWRVRAVNEHGQSSWSSAWSFTTESTGSGGDDSGGGNGGGSDNDGDNDDDNDNGSGGDVPGAPELVAPDNNGTNVSLTPTFSWSEVEGADYYIIHASRTNPSTMVIDREVSATSFSPDEPLDPETVYDWRVRAVSDGVEGEWSGIYRFTTQSSGNDDDGESGGGNSSNGPNKTTPANNSETDSNRPVFRWEQVEDAESYTIEISSADYTDSADDFYLTDETADTVYTPHQSLRANGRYQWRVRANFADGSESDWGEAWEFAVNGEELAFETELQQNYPNPFNPTTNIRFTLGETQEVNLRVYDMAGRLVATLYNNTLLQSGPHETTFNAASLASGIYFYRIVTETEVITRKMTLMK